MTKGRFLNVLSLQLRSADGAAPANGHGLIPGLPVDDRFVPGRNDFFVPLFPVMNGSDDDLFVVPAVPDAFLLVVLPRMFSGSRAVFALQQRQIRTAAAADRMQLVHVLVVSRNVNDPMPFLVMVHRMGLCVVMDHRGDRRPVVTSRCRDRFRIGGSARTDIGHDARRAAGRFLRHRSAVTVPVGRRFRGRG